MRLSVQTDYSLRVLMHLAVTSPKLVTIRDIADRFQISRNHLMKVVNALARAGFVDTTRGRTGGIRLARDPAEIGIGDVVRTFESDSHLVECFNAEKNTCLLTSACRLKGALLAASNAFYAELDHYRLSDFTRGNSLLASLISDDVSPNELVTPAV